MSKKHYLGNSSWFSQRENWDDGREADQGQTSEDYRLPSRKAIIYASELDYISRCMLDYPNSETGGQLFGFWTSTGTPVVTYVIGPGHDAQHNPTSFVQDQEYLQTIGKELHKMFRLQHIGEWHSHHRLGLTHPSGGDVNTMQYGVGKPGFPRLLLCIGTLDGNRSTINPYNFHENRPGEYERATWDVVNIESPYRRLIDTKLQQLLSHPRTLEPSLAALHVGSTAQEVNKSISEHWLTERVENVETMKAFVAIVKDFFQTDEVKVEMLPSGEPTIVVNERHIKLKLPHGFPSKAPVFMEQGYGSRPGEEHLSDYHSAIWSLGEEPLVETFRRWLFAFQTPPPITAVTPPPITEVTPPPITEVAPPPFHPREIPIEDPQSQEEERMNEQTNK